MEKEFFLRILALLMFPVREKAVPQSHTPSTISQNCDINLKTFFNDGPFAYLKRFAPHFES